MEKGQLKKKKVYSLQKTSGFQKNKSNFMSQRYLTFDILRGVSAILIILYHYTVRYNEKPFTVDYQTDWNFHCHFGFAAVTTFFIMSGFFSGKIITKQSNPIKVLSKRLNRLLPTFWASATISAIVLYFFWKEASVNLIGYVGNLTMIPGLLRVKAIDGAYWTMQLELFWAIWLSALLLIKRIRWRKLIIMIWISMSICLSFFDEISHPLLSIIRIILMTSFSSAFIAGASLWIILNEKSEKMAWILLCLCLANQLAQHQTIYHDIFFVVTVCLILMHRKIDTYLRETSVWVKFITWIASISYPLYLLHQMIGFAIILNLRKLGLDSELIILIPIAVNIVIASMVHRYVEINKKLNPIRI